MGNIVILWDGNKMFKLESKMVKEENEDMVVRPESDLSKKEKEYNKKDHEDAMDKKKRLHNYHDSYEEAIINRERRQKIPKNIMEMTAAKREFGIKKYGGYSFQTSFENAMTCCIEEHIQGEIIDLINYMNHKALVFNFLGYSADQEYKHIDELVKMFTHYMI